MSSTTSTCIRGEQIIPHCKIKWKVSVSGNYTEGSAGRECKAGF